MGQLSLTIALFLASAVRLTGPLLLPALGELVSERSGVLNIGLEGIMLSSAFGAVAGAAAGGNPLMGALAAMVIGGLSALALGLLVVVLRADQIVAGIGFNILALGVTSLLRQEILGAQAKPAPVGVLGNLRIPILSDIPIVGAAFFNQSPLIYLAAVIAVLLWWMFRSSLLGLVVRSAGEGAIAADSAGVDVVAVRLSAMAFTGVMAGLGGAYLGLVAGSGVFVDNMTAGRGYLAIAVAIFGRWQPLWACATALLFGAADALQYQGQSLGLSVPAPILLMSPFLVVLGAWVVLGRSKAAPADLGRPFLRGAG